MVHFAWRVQHGVPLYPDWKHYPHVANFYAPLNFVLVGSLGKAFGSDLTGLYLIGRIVTVASVILTSLVLGLAIYRRAGILPALVGTASALASARFFTAA